MRFAPLVLALSLVAQSAPLLPPTPAEFGQWERLSTVPDRGGLSPDGRWLAYGINRTNGENDLRVTSIADGGTKTIAFGAQPAFSADSRWVAVSVGCVDHERRQLPGQGEGDEESWFLGFRLWALGRSPGACSR